MRILAIKVLHIKTILGREASNPITVARSNSKNSVFLDSGQLHGDQCSTQARPVVLNFSPVHASTVPNRKDNNLSRFVVHAVDDR
jgi:hypothetical protein